MVLREVGIGSDLYLSKINLVFGGTRITGERLPYFLKLRSHAAGVGASGK